MCLRKCGKAWRIIVKPSSVSWFGLAWRVGGQVWVACLLNVVCFQYLSVRTALSRQYIFDQKGHHRNDHMEITIWIL